MNKDARFSQKYEIFSKKSMWGGVVIVKMRQIKREEEQKNIQNRKIYRIEKYTEQKNYRIEKYTEQRNDPEGKILVLNS